MRFGVVSGLLLALGIGAFGCGDRGDDDVASDQSIYRNQAWGYSVAVPPGWYRVAQPRSPGSGDPVVILAMATFPLRDEDAAYPIPRQGFGADEAFVTILERGLEPGGWKSFPTRPQQFRFEPNRGSVPAEYVRRATGIAFRDHWFNFTDAGRHFHVQVAIGDLVSRSESDEPYRILDTLRFDPEVKPDWPSAG
jgi:hypothetical protein